MKRIFQQLFEAKSHLEQGATQKAKRLYSSIQKETHDVENPIKQITANFINQGELTNAIISVFGLTNMYPENFSYCCNLVNLQLGNGENDAAIKTYQRFILHNPKHSNAYFNLAHFQARMKDYERAIENYQHSLSFSKVGVEEIYNNLGLIYSALFKPKLAQQAFVKSLAVNGCYLPAKYNLAGLHEEMGDVQKAKQLYLSVLKIDPNYYKAITRLAFLQTNNSSNSDVEKMLIKSLENLKNEPFACESIYFALGKVYDDCGCFKQAAIHFDLANKLQSDRTDKNGLKTYDAIQVETFFDNLTFTSLIPCYSKNAIDKVIKKTCNTDKKLIFICGMFRSGSTLLEQYLAKHNDIHALGENSFFPNLAKSNQTKKINWVKNLSNTERNSLANQYMAEAKLSECDEGFIIDKRPDNFLHIHLIKTIFPDAKIIFTHRNIKDNALSIYFQQLVDEFRYATSLENICHYYQLSQSLMEHWSDMFIGDTVTVIYEEFIARPEETIETLLEFCGIEKKITSELSMRNVKQDICTGEFKEVGESQTMVKTASLWQVRESIHSRSVGRWKNYQNTELRFKLR